MAKTALQGEGLIDRLNESKLTTEKGNELIMGWYGHHPEFNLYADINCYAKYGIGQYGGSGSNTTQVYDLYQTLYDTIRDIQSEKSSLRKVIN